MSTTTQVSQGIRNALGMWVATARALQPKAVTRTVRVTTNEGKNTMANAIRKRIALAAALAVSAGLLGAVPAQAARGNADATQPFFVKYADYVADSAGVAIDNSTSGSVTDNTVAVSHNASNVNNYVELNSAASQISAATFGYRIDVTGTTVVSSSTGTVNSARTSVSYTTIDTSTVLRISTAAAGSSVVKVVKLDVSGGNVTETVLQTFNITVTAAKVTGIVSAAKSTSVIDSATGASAADETIVASAAATANGGRVAGILVTAKDANGAAVKGKTIAATVSGPGTLTIETATTQPTSSTGRAVSKAMTSGGTAIDTATVYVFADGTSGVSTVTITVDGVTVGTEKVTFYGKTAKLTVTVNEPHIALNTEAVKAIKVVATDSNGVPVAGDSLTIAADGVVVTDATGTGGSSTTVATDSSGVVEIDATATTIGNGTVTITSGSTTTVKETVNLVGTDATIASLVLTSNKATYAAGEKITLTLTAKDKNGVLMGKKAFAGLFTDTMTASSAVVGSLFGTAVTFSAGVATVDVYAPLAAGTLTFSGKTGTAGLATAEQGVTKSLSVTISGSADIAQIKADLAALQKSTSDLIAALSAQVSYLRKQLNQLLRRR